jgi:bifunctional UDP-N-acetylglucosamine pyrophosphorylase/glucosamine-1-phosphate N-acetyltransferase
MSRTGGYVLTALSKIGALIMAAGKGTRMKSVLPKVLHRIIDEPILSYILRTVHKAGIKKSAVIVGHKGEMIEEYLKSSSWQGVDILWQHEQLGTGHAVQVSQKWWCEFENILVLNGDLPMLTHGTIQSFIKEHIDSSSDCSLLSFTTKNPGAYGRVIRSKDGQKVSIVEHKDATEEERKVNEVNAGVYIFKV